MYFSSAFTRICLDHTNMLRNASGSLRASGNASIQPGDSQLFRMTRWRIANTSATPRWVLQFQVQLFGGT